MKKNISKTVRLPDDLVAYIENQEGETFSDKLRTILLNCKKSEKEGNHEAHKRQVL